MAAQRSVGRFCSVVTNDLTSLAQIDAVNLGIGAQVFVLSNSRSYRLSASVLTTMSPVTILAAGSVGTWIQENAVNDQSLFVYGTAQSPIITTVTNTWHAAPSTAGLYTAAVAKACWSVDTTTGIVTYNGPTAQFYIQYNISFSGGSTGDLWDFSLTRNGALVGTTTADPLSTITTQNDTLRSFATVISSQNILPPGTTYQSVMRNVGAGTSFRFQKFQMFFQLLPSQ